MLQSWVIVFLPAIQAFFAHETRHIIGTQRHRCVEESCLCKLLRHVSDLGSLTSDTVLTPSRTCSGDGLACGHDTDFCPLVDDPRRLGSGRAPTKELSRPSRVSIPSGISMTMA